MKLANRGVRELESITASYDDYGKPRTWADYKEETERVQQKTAKLSKVALDRGVRQTLMDSTGRPSPEGFRKSAQAFVGPIMLRLKYQGLLRDVLVESPLEQGELPIYDFFNNMDHAFALNDYSGEVQIIRMEAGKLDVPLLRIMQAVTVPRSEVRAFKFDLIERIKQQMMENIMRKEDQRLFAALDLVISNHSRAELGEGYENYPDPEDYTIQNIGPFSPMTFAKAFAAIGRAQLPPESILINMGDYYDVFNWGVNAIGFAAVERLTDTGVMSNFGPGAFRPSPQMPRGKAYVLPPPEYVGWMPIGYGVTVDEVHEPLNDRYGYVASELIGYGVASPFGIVGVNKVAA